MATGDTGTVYLTADTDITGGAPCRVYAVHEIYSSSSTGSVLRNGTSSSGTIYVSLKSVDSTGVTHTFGEKGIRFPDGLFFDEGTAVTSILIEFRTEK